MEFPSDEPESDQLTSTENLASMVYRGILSDILEARLEPGRKLVLRSLRETYRVGNSPIREALNRLAGERLVVGQDRHGFQVAPASAE